jgi:hypothetical protein
VTNADGLVRSEDGNAVVVGAEGDDVFPGDAGVGCEIGVVSGLDGAVERVDDVIVTFQPNVEIKLVALG